MKSQEQRIYHNMRQTQRQETALRATITGTGWGQPVTLRRGNLRPATTQHNRCGGRAGI